MIRVLIADDEPSITETLKNHIPWAELGVGEVFTASNGNEAVEIIGSEQPDIALLDIQMPGKNGLELSREISQQGLPTQVILISGYAEFSYAQRAMQYGVLGYCLKPVEISELTALIQKAVERLEEKPESAATDAAILDAIITGDTGEVAGILTGHGLDPDAFYLASSVSDQPVLDKAALSFTTGKQLYFYLAGSRITPEDFGGYDGDPAISGISIYPGAINAASLRDAIYRCDAMCYSFFIEPGVKYRPFMDESQAVFHINQLAEAVSMNSRERVLELLENLRQPKVRDLFSIHNAQQLINCLVSDPGFLPDAQDYRVYHYRQLVYSYGTFENMLTELSSLVQGSERDVRDEESGGNAYFLKIAKYLENCYGENISLSDAAKLVNLSPSYISQLFRRVTGDTFTHYLTGIRVRKAQALLTESDASISDIALRTGFNDYFYFLKTFKKVTGQTPSEYRA